ncbi:protein of unknown function [Azospirillum lipoferum 4B]|uniref:Uncharacterized protein n=1 Tax=Azospirillum lipoferum (strain 4B) TaxID=862719 RepID=G7Z2H0_AZOL4|nr:protein of unknown function [Azospirillum lipoferum 4B]
MHPPPIRCAATRSKPVESMGRLEKPAIPDPESPPAAGARDTEEGQSRPPRNYFLQVRLKTLEPR